LKRYNPDEHGEESKYYRIVDILEDRGQYVTEERVLLGARTDDSDKTIL